MKNKHEYDPLNYITIKDDRKMDKLSLRPNLKNLLERIIEIDKLTCGTSVLTDPQSLLDGIISRLKSVPYIPYPVSFSTVDMIAIKEEQIESTINPIKPNTSKTNIFVLLGKKYNQTQWQFPGGFRDPCETSAIAASREFMEEASVQIDPERFRYVGELFVDDRRYKDSPHKITTSMFLVNLMDDEIDLVKGGDDLEMVQWFPLDELREHKMEWMRQIHHRIFEFIFENPENI